MSFQAPRLPDRYTPSTLVGEGGMGQVWSAWDTVLDVPVAIKVIRPTAADRPEFQARFVQEVSLQARFEHPNLVPLHDAGQLPGGQLYLAMALAEHGSLARYLPDGVPWETAHRLVDEVLDALAALHTRGVVHRDLKPENILLHLGLDWQPHVWIADLGVARLLDGSSSVTSASAGTPAFMAPEQYSGSEAELSPRVDLFAMGVILSHLVGRHPVPEGLADLILAMANPESLLRPPLAADIRLALDDLGPPVAPLPPLPFAPGVSAPTWIPDWDDPSPQPNGPPIESATMDEQPWPAWRRLVPPAPPPHPPPETAVPHRLRASLSLYTHREISIIGRDDERERLWSLVRDVRDQGRPGVAIIVGEAGSGKTRLVESLVHTLEEGAWSENLGVSYQDPPSPLDGFLGLVHRVIRPWSETEAETRKRLVRWFRLTLVGVPAEPMAALTAHACHSRTDDPERTGMANQLVHWLLHTRCSRGMTCLAVENAHLALRAGEGLDIPVHFLNQAALGQPAPVLVICTVRSEALAENVELRRRVQLLVESGACRIDLPRLDLDETRTLLDRSIDLDPALRDIVARRCDGNPLLARQIIRFWAEQGWLVEVGSLVYTLRPDVNPGDAMPNDVRDLFLDRAHTAIASAPDPAAIRDALHGLALAGTDLPLIFFDILAGPVAPALRASGLLVLDDGYWQFSHPLLRHAMVEEARGRPDHAELHRRVAEAWKNLHAFTGENVEVPRALALLEAGEPAVAFLPLARAAIEEQERGSFLNAIRLGEAAIRAMYEADLVTSHPLAARVLSATAIACIEQPNLKRAEDLGHLALQAARNAQDRAVARITLGTVAASRADWPLTVLYLEASLYEAQAIGREDLRAMAFATLGYGAIRAGRLDEAVRNLEQARDMTHPGLGAGLRSTVLRRLGHARSRQGHFSEARHLCEEALHLAQRSGTGLEETSAHRALGLVLQEMNDEAGSRRHLEAAARPPATSANARSLVVLQALADLHRLEGRHVEARKLLHLLAQWGESREMPYEAADANTRLLMLGFMSGDDDIAEAAATQATRLLENLEAPHLMGIAWGGTALLAARQGREANCRVSAQSAREGLGTPQADRDLAWVLHRLAVETEHRGWADITEWAAENAAATWRMLDDPTKEAEARQILERVDQSTAEVWIDTAESFH